MRSISVVVNCDACESEIPEEVEGENTVRFTVYGEEWELELCDNCIRGTFLQEARPVKNRRKKKTDKPFKCHCGKSFGTKRGLSAHKTRQAHD